MKSERFIGRGVEGGGFPLLEVSEECGQTWYPLWAANLVTIQGLNTMPTILLSLVCQLVSVQRGVTNITVLWSAILLSIT